MDQMDMILYEVRETRKQIDLMKDDNNKKFNAIHEEISSLKIKDEKLSGKIKIIIVALALGGGGAANFILKFI